MNRFTPTSSMRHGHARLSSLLAALALAGVAIRPFGAVAAASRRPGPEADFRSPPADARPLTWWHWLNGNITRDGITRDLEAIARAGLRGCYMFNCGGMWPTGDVKFLSAEWLGMVDHTLREAERLGLAFGVHNCDGFSEAGGPWITPETSMKILVWTSADVEGPAPADVTLPRPETREGFYRDIAVVAFPVPAGGPMRPAKVSGAAPAQLANLSDGNPATRAVFAASAAGHRVDFAFDAPRVVRSLSVAGCLPHRWEEDTPFLLEVSDDGERFRPVGSFTVNWDYQAGDIATAAFEDTTGRVFRVAFTNAWTVQIGELALSDAARVHFAEAKAGRLRSRGHGAEARHHRAHPGPSPDRAVPRDCIVSAASVTNLSGRMAADGRLSWTPPPGRWRVLRIGFTSNGHHVSPATPEGRGLECDKLDAAVVRFHLEQYVGRLLKLAGPRVGRVLAAMEIDSWECGIQNWTDGLDRRFRDRMGYDLFAFWPAMLEGWIVDDADATERALWDWRRFLADQFGENFFRVASEFARENGLTYVAESTGRQQYLYDVAWHRHSGVPMGEFWLDAGPGQGVRVDNKVASSIAHISGTPIVASESYTASPNAARWQNHPFTLKVLGDRAFCAGVNQFVFHTFAHQPYEAVGPGFTFFHWGLNFNRGNTWWDDAAAWMDYLARCQFMLRQGRFVADVLAWVGEDVPNRIAWRDELAPPLPDGFEFDGADARAVMDARVEEGRIALPSGARYRVLLLPPLATMRPPLAAKVRRLLEDGAVVVAPRPPLRSPSFRDRGAGDEQVRASLGTLWEGAGGDMDRRVGRGRLLSGPGFAEIFTRLGVPPDFAWHSQRPDAAIGWVHRRVDAWPADVYFVCNSMNRTETIEAVFRDAAGAPELWDPADGSIRRPGAYRRERDGRCVLTLRLDPHGSVFVVFRPDPVRAPRVAAVREDRPASAAPPAAPAPEAATEAEGEFTIAVRARPAAGIPLPEERRDAIALRQANWAVFPPQGATAWGDGHAGVGISAGTNGVVVFEHSARHGPAVATHAADLRDFAHIAVVCRGGAVALYLDGREVRRGRPGDMKLHARIGAGPPFLGERSAPSLWRRALSPAEILALAEAARADERAAAALPPPEIERLPDGRILARRWSPSPVSLEMSDGRSVELPAADVPPAIEVTGRWTIRFPAGRGAPEAVEMDRLESLSVRSEPGLRHFAGTAEYSVEFDLPAGALSPDREWYLDLGDVQVIATPSLNGRRMPTLWKPPFRTRVDAHLAAGRNRLDARVTTLWPNRMIGDAAMPDDIEWMPGRDTENVPVRWPEWLLRGLPRPSGRLAFCTRGGVYAAGDPLLPSGLIGPVRLLPAARSVLPTAADAGASVQTGGCAKEGG